MLLGTTTRKSQPDRSPISRHLDEWERVSRDYRDRKVGPDWFDQVENFYNLIDQGGPMPSFRPLIRLTDLQTLMLKEANHLADAAPRPYIYSNLTGKRDKEREKGLQSEWRRASVNFHSIFAMLLSLYSGMAPLEFGFDSELRNGKGGTWVKAVDPRRLLFDITTDYTMKWAYVMKLTPMHYQEVRRKWPITSRDVKPRITSGHQRSPVLGEAGYGFQMPEGPMSTMPGVPNKERSMFGDDMVMVRDVYCIDYTREKIEDQTIPDGAVVPPDFQWKFPNGRWITECEGNILADGDNPYPFRTFPYILFFSTPPLFGLWAPPAVRFSIDLQNVASRMYTNNFENAVRLNNGVWFIDERCGIDPNLFGGIPAEVQIINSNSPVPQCVWPHPMPQHMLQMPELLLNKQKEVQGYTEARQGKPGAGNISPELQDAAVFQSEGLTQLRERLAADSFLRLSKLMFGTMARYMDRQYLPLRGQTDMETVLWTPLERPDQYDVDVDEADIRAVSQTVINKLAPELRKVGALSVRDTLEGLNWPNAEEAAERYERELALQALGKTRGNRR